MMGNRRFRMILRTDLIVGQDKLGKDLFDQRVLVFLSLYLLVIVFFL